MSDGTANTMIFAEDAGRQTLYRNGVAQPTPRLLNSAWGDYNVKITVHGWDANATVQNGGCAAINVINHDEIYAFHSGVANVGMGDGSVRIIPSNINMTTFMQMSTIAGGETTPDL